MRKNYDLRGNKVVGNKRTLDWEIKVSRLPAALRTQIRDEALPGYE